MTAVAALIPHPQTGLIDRFRLETLWFEVLIKNSGHVELTKEDKKGDKKSVILSKNTKGRSRRVDFQFRFKRFKDKNNNKGLEKGTKN